MSIKLTPKVRAYAQSVANIGERMGRTANSFGEVSDRNSSTFEEIKETISDYKQLLKEFESQEKDLQSLSPPGPLEKEHENLVISYRKYVTATNGAIESLDADKIKTDQDILKEAQSLQWEASKEIVEISNTMAEKLGIK